MRDPGWQEWYDSSCKVAEDRFKGLSDELAKRLEVKPIVLQTGGMVMCLQVPIGKHVSQYGEPRHYALFSELAEHEVIGMGIYHEDMEGELESEEYFEYPFNDAFTEESIVALLTIYAQSQTWSDFPLLCRVVANWAAPLIVNEAVKLSRPS